MSVISPIAYFSSALCRRFETNNNLVAIVSDSKNSSKTNSVAALYPERFFQLGISEQDTSGTAVGLSYEGFIPFVFAYTAYLLPRSYEQLRNHISLNRSVVNLVGTHCSFTGYNPGDRSYEDLALARNIDRLKILTPSSASEIDECLELMTSGEASYYLRLPNCSNMRDRVQGATKISGTLLTAFQGRGKVAIITYGILADQVTVAAENLDVSVYTVNQQNPEFIRSTVKYLMGYKDVLFVEDHKRFGSLHDMIFSQLPQTNVHFHGVPRSTHLHGSENDIMQDFKLTSREIKNIIERILDEKF